LREREPGPLEWMLQGGVEPMRSVTPDPFVTWELRTAVGQVATPPVAAPADLDQLRIAHNVAAAAGRAADQAKLRAQLLAMVNVPVHATYDNGTKLLGAVNHRGAERSLTLLFEAGKFSTQTKYAVHAVVTGRKFLSTLPVDPANLDTALPPNLPTLLWVPGHIYAIKVVYHQRAGHERFTGEWVAGPRRTDAPKEVELLRL
jgi:hypothetical protein